MELTTKVLPWLQTVIVIVGVIFFFSEQRAFLKLETQQTAKLTMLLEKIDHRLQTVEQKTAAYGEAIEFLKKNDNNN